PGRKVLGAKLLNGGTIQWKQLDGTLEITVPPDLRDPADTVVELTMDASLEDLAAVEAGEVSMFHDNSTFGQIISRRAKVSTSSRHPADPGKPESLVAAEAPADFAFHTKEETNPWVVLDLGNIYQATGLRVLNRIRAGRPGVERAASLRLSVSTDGATWQEAWHADSAEEQWEIPLSSVRAGAEVPGREARYLRLELRNSEPTPLHLRQIEVWGTPE
ncbi:MAG: discoidin domain-containing protein, partial [Verrucomicrobiae bacterium]|nr:discoidin domain-containing protein [Verrucomicrobiae bacterium]